jgi:DNA-binding CsgD family transcriptional regulator
VKAADAQLIDGEPLLGRDNELAKIQRAVSGSRDCSGVVIAGGPGVGKTRLAREILSRAAASGKRTNWVVGTESVRSVPLGAFVGTIGDAISNPLSDVRRVINSFVRQQDQKQVLIGVDDAHLLDGLSAHVVHQLAQSRGTRLVVTLRTGGEEPDAVTALWKDGLLKRMELEPLSADHTRTYIEATLAGPVDSRTAQRFWKLTNGNLLFLRQLVQDQITAGRIRQSAGVWIWDDDVAVSPSMSDIVGRQLRRLDPEIAEVVDMLSVCEPLSAGVVQGLAPRADLESAEQMRLLVFERRRSELLARLAHPMFGELRRATAGEMHLSHIRGRLAQRLGQDTDPDMHATVRRALLTLESDLPADPQLYLEAARHAMTLLDLDLAGRFASAAVEAGSSDAIFVRAMNLVLLGRGQDAEDDLRRICEDGVEGTHRAMTMRAANLVWMLGRPDDASAVLDNVGVDRESVAERMERAAVHACIDAVSARCEAAREKAMTALHSGALSDFYAMMASVALTMSMGALGDIDDLPTVAEEAFERATTSFQASHMRFWFGGVYARACRLTGCVEECVRFVECMAESARDVPGLAYANLAFLVGYADLVRGNMPGAVKLLHEALAGVEMHGVVTGLRPASCFALVEAHAKLGQPEAANEALVEARSCVAPDYLFMDTALSVATGWALVASGRLVDAVAIVQEAAALARDRNQPTHELACLQVVTQWGDVSGADRARELAGELLLPLAKAVAWHAESLKVDDGEGLLGAAAGYRAIGDLATAADAAAQAATAFASRQLLSRATYASAIARQLADECGGLCTPALRAPAGHPLTPRQREIAEMVLAGLSNREIADQLVMSVRSVEGHLYRACIRVGAASREELAALMKAGPAGCPRGS